MEVGEDWKLSKEWQYFYTFQPPKHGFVSVLNGDIFPHDYAAQGCVVKGLEKNLEFL